MTKSRYKDRVAVITGAADGIGKAIAERLAKEGASIALWDFNQDKLLALEKEWQEAGMPVKAIVVDISKEAAVQDAYQATVNHFGKLDILVNSAGIVGPTQTKITDYATEEFDKIYNVNLKGSFLTAKYALKYMEKAQYGRILLIASIAGKEGNPNMVGYSATKAGVIGLVKALGKEYATSGITVNGLAPAVILTAMNKDTDPAQLEYMASKIPMQRLGTVDEAASIASWILSEEASFNTGFVFDLSGGRATY
ncbi:SDR family NAD(P)-dependent oxidoreductase [Cyclobacterium marinum]|uniref:Short-chain dehydrogenase/reductase SDR n=1 Tax=Cyclobacterium marinum (strain ATCC 25205 / DSM 745 / LMG 13164 / NCIMB 1802) TaxID=880070 RepID=G0J5W7_CYCMS|nr:SDR family NAD(P)-dependent oxidoreductase [Cyclobacterium marinum]AEL25418.1 short-chain dehydrogenase/reductase SDR [Cyclobacterium marinum DSM 745]